MMQSFISSVEKGKIPDWLIRTMIRIILRQSLADEEKESVCRSQERMQALVKQLRESPIVGRAELDDVIAKRLPLDFYKHVLGPNLKFSCCYWPEGVTDLEDAETESMRLVCSRAALEDGLKILDYGCGWGSLSLFLAEKFPNCQITALSYSGTHVRRISEECARRGLTNVTPVQGDINTFNSDAASCQHFDRILCVESLAHQANYEGFFERFGTWLTPTGKLFVQSFCHKERAYHMSSDDDDWMNRYFVNAGIMPSDRLFIYMQRHLFLEDHWRMDGTHYSRTVEAWLENLDSHKEAIMPSLVRRYEAEAERWYFRWRMFFLTFSEFFAFRRGNEWLVSHYLFSHR